MKVKHTEFYFTNKYDQRHFPLKTQSKTDCASWNYGLSNLLFHFTGSYEGFLHDLNCPVFQLHKYQVLISLMCKIYVKSKKAVEISGHTNFWIAVNNP